MNSRLTLAEAAEELIKSGKARTLEKAREGLVCALITGRMAACCEEYSTQSVPPVSKSEQDRFGHAGLDNGVPVEFWRIEHAENFDRDPNGGMLPSGSWGCWDQGLFVTDVVMTGANAAAQYRDFLDLAAEGSQPVDLSFTASGVSLSRLDVERMPGGRSLYKLIENAKARVSLRMGNVSKSDLEITIARFCASLLIDHAALDVQEDAVFRRLVSSGTEATSQQRMKPDRLRNFARLVVQQYREIQFFQSQLPPTS